MRACSYSPPRGKLDGNKLPRGASAGAEPTPLKPLWENGEEVVAVGIPGFLQVQVSSLDAKMVTCKRELAKRRRPVRRTGNSY